MSLSDWGSLASILGLGLTGWALWEIRRLRRFYVFKARVPELLANLDQHASTLAGCLSDFPNSENLANKELAQIQATLKSLEPKLQGASKRSVKRLLESLEIQGQTPNERRIKQTYLSVITVVSEIENLQEDLEWQQR